MQMDEAAVAVVAKTRAIYGQRLSPADYEELLSRRTVSDIAAYLKNSTHYAKALEGINESSVHRGQLENILRREVFEIYMRLVHFEPVRPKGFYRYLIARREIEQILDRIMYLNAESDDAFILNLPSYLIRHASFDLLALAKARSFEELCEVIRDTPYYDAIAAYEPDARGQIDFTGCEVALYTLYYSRLFSDIERDFDGDDRKELLDSVGRRVDLDNIVSIFRLKLYFKTPPAEIRRHLIPFHGSLTPARLDALLGAQDGAELLQKLQGTPFERSFAGADPTHIEMAARGHMYHRFRMNLRQSTNAAMSILSLMTLYDIEINNIFHIIEGIRYNVPKSDIEKLLIL